MFCFSREAEHGKTKLRCAGLLMTDPSININVGPSNDNALSKSRGVR